jgi:hypothetical protein
MGRKIAGLRAQRRGLSHYHRFSRQNSVVWTYVDSG